MSERPLMASSFDNLIDIFNSAKTDILILTQLYEELSHRKKNHRVPLFQKNVSVAIKKIKAQDSDSIASGMGKSERPLIESSFDELVVIFNSAKKDMLMLTQLYEELSHRKKNRRVPSFQKEVSAAIKKIEVKDSNPVATEIGNNLALHKEVITNPSDVPINWDTEQRTVIELDESETRIIEAGPGSGKTAVACARVAHLIEECGLEASKIFLISFTRTAVKELCDRIEGFAEDPIDVAGLQIFTLDSFTWQVLRGLGDDSVNDLMGSFETNIKQFTQQLKDGDAQLLEYLEEFEHVILDECQDLIGDRAELAITIIKNLEDSCGVTVFADSAQAIYGFTNDTAERDENHSLTVVERIMEGELSNFDRIKLINIHRTDDQKLKELFRKGRDSLLDRKEGDIHSWKVMKQFIMDCSHGVVEDVIKQDLGGKSDHLVLYRTRAEVLMASSYLWSEGVIHKLRMSGTPPRVHPWIGRLLGEFDGDKLTKVEFNNLWNERIAAGNVTPSDEREKAWDLLLANVGNKHGQVRVVRLREILSRDRPPIDFLIDESDLAGPVLGTIHASKGREANQVNLMLPPDNFINDDQTSEYAHTPREIAEEERVLFVGATRAKQKLMVGEGSKLYASCLESGRTYKKPKSGKGRRIIEVGLVGDIDPVTIVSNDLKDGGYDLQNWLWTNATSKVDVEARYSHELETNVLYAKGDDKQLGLFSKRFNKDLWALADIVAKKQGEKKLNLGSKISNIRMVGVTTVVIPETQRNTLPVPWRHSGFLLVPVITGFTMVYFNKRNEK